MLFGQKLPRYFWSARLSVLMRIIGCVSGEIPEALRPVVRYQRGIVTRKQAIDAGMPTNVIKSKIRSGRWQQVYCGVYATFTGQRSREATLWAAVLYAGRGAALSHETAAELHALIDHCDQDIHVTVPHRRKVLAVSGIVIHRSRRPADGGWRLPDGEIPRTWVEDTIFDLADATDNVDDVCALVTRAFAKRKTSTVIMCTTLDRRKRQRWRDEIREMIVAADGGAHSVLEFRYDRDVEGAHGLPESKRQVAFIKRDGGKGYRDRVYEKYHVIVELDGKQTHTDENQWDDKRRDNDAAAGGQQSLRYDWKAVRWDACGTALQVAEVLRSHGWKGALRPCSPECCVAKVRGAEIDLAQSMDAAAATD